MAFGKRPIPWYFQSHADNQAPKDDSDAHLAAVFVGDDFDPAGETIILQKQQPPNLHSYLRAATKKKNTHRAEGVTAEELMDLNLLVGQ